MRRINDTLGRFYLTLVYVYLSVTLGKDRHIHTVTLGKDRHIHIRIYACARMDTKRWRLKRLLWRDGEGWQERERVLQNISGWLREMQFVQATTDE